MLIKDPENEPSAEEWRELARAWPDITDRADIFYIDGPDGFDCLPGSVRAAPLPADTHVPNLPALPIFSPTHEELTLVAVEEHAVEPRITVSWETGWKQYPRHTASVPIMPLRDAIRLAERLRGRCRLRTLLDLAPGADQPRWDRITLVDTDDCVSDLDEPTYHVNRWLAEARIQAKAGTNTLAPFNDRWLPLAPITRLRRAQGLRP